MWEGSTYPLDIGFGFHNSAYDLLTGAASSKTTVLSSQVHLLPLEIGGKSLLAIACWLCADIKLLNMEEGMKMFNMQVHLNATSQMLWPFLGLTIGLRKVTNM